MGGGLPSCSNDCQSKRKSRKQYGQMMLDAGEFLREGNIILNQAISIHAPQTPTVNSAASNRWNSCSNLIKRGKMKNTPENLAYAKKIHHPNKALNLRHIRYYIDNFSGISEEHRVGVEERKYDCRDKV